MVQAALAFENQVLTVVQLPHLQGVTFNPLHKDYLIIRLMRWLIFYILLAVGAIVLYTNTDLEWSLLIPIWAVVAVGFTWLEVVAFKRKGYAIREHDISFRSGLIFHRIVTVPLTRIQHSDVSQGPIARLFDLATVHIYTAGGSDSDLRIPGLPEEEAQRVREFITKIVAEDATDKN